MSALSDASRFLELVLLGTVAYLAYGYSAGHDVDVLSIGLFLAGSLAVVLLTIRFADDYALEAE